MQISKPNFGNGAIGCLFGEHHVAASMGPVSNWHFGCPTDNQVSTPSNTGFI
jgi:hypothetical protein